MKSIAEWLMELPSPYRRKALKYHSEYNKMGKADCLENALVLAFRWTSTKEGGAYWKDVHETLKTEIKMVKRPVRSPQEIKPEPIVELQRPKEIIVFRPFSSRKEQIENQLKNKL